MKKFIVTLLLAGMYGIPAMYAQTSKVISGKVTDAKTNMPVSGASIYVRGASIGVVADSSTVANFSIGTVSDEAGEFTFTANTDISGKYLVASSMGYRSQEMRITAQDRYVFALEEETERDLNEVVVTGYQNIQKKKSTGAVSVIKMDKIKQTGVQSVDQMLGGQLSGVTVLPVSGAPGEAATIRIRGVASINGSQDPLWVVDGLPIDGTNLPTTQTLGSLFSTSIAGFNTSDIESITVLKDAAATAIYGARAANGVIVVTTRNGRKAEKLRVSYNSDYTFTQKPDISRLNLLNSNQKVDLELALFRSDYTFMSDRGGVARIFNKYKISKKELIEKGFSGINANAQQEINALRNIHTDWNDVLFRKAFTQNQNISISGGGDKARYYFSGGFYDEKGATAKTGARRYNLTLKTEFDLSKKLTFGVGLFANQREQNSFFTQSQGSPGPIEYSRLANPYTPVYDANGNYFYDEEAIVGDGKELRFNMVEELNNTTNKLKTQALLANFKADYKIREGLVLSSQLGLQQENTNTEQIALEETFAMRKLKFLSKDNKTGKTFLPTGGMQAIANSRLSQMTWKNMLEYNRNFAEQHDINLMAGNELRSIDTKGETRRGFGYNPQTLTIQPVVYPTTSDADGEKSYNTNNFFQNRFASFFATGAYTYSDKYTLSGSIRFDGSDLFGVDPKYKYLPIWSVGGLWRISEEAFLKNSSVVNNLSLHASYGLQGNIDKSTSRFFVGTYSPRNILPGNAVEAILVQNAQNEKLRWEKTINTNIGLDFTFFKNRVSGSVDFYKRIGKDLIDIRMLPLETGFSSQMVNWGSVENKGVEIALSTRNIVTDNFRWTTDFNISYNTNKVLKQALPGNAYLPSKEGLPINSIFTLPVYGIDPANGQILMDNNGQPQSLVEYYHMDYAFYDDFGVAYAITQLSSEELRGRYRYSGTTQPLYSGGFTNTFSYKNVDLSVGMIFNLGHSAQLQPAYNLYDYNRGYNVSADILDRWTPENTSGKYPRLVSNTPGVADTVRAAALFLSQGENLYYPLLSSWLRDAGYIRVRNITLGYTVPAKNVQHWGISSIRFTAEARNPFVLLGNYDGFLDPETMGNRYAQPIPKTFALGVSVML